MTRISNILFLLVFLLVGCAAKIDGSSEETMKASMERVRSSLSEKKKAEFDKALMLIGFSQINFADMLSGSADDEGSVSDKIRKTLDGKTADQVIDEANRIRTEREEKERAQALDEIKELEDKQRAAQDAVTALKRFRVLRSRFYLESGILGPEPFIELSVQNDTSHAISRAFFEGTIASPNRSVPWHRDTFNYSISGGLEPGEKAHWRLKPSMFSGWDSVNAPADAVFTVTVQRLDGPNEETLFDASGFSERDQSRLEELKKQYP